MRFKLNKISHNRKTLYMILGIMVVSIFTLSIAYAVLSTTLNITGSAEISSASWNIYLENVKVKSGSVEANAPQISGTSSVSFDVDLTLPGDFYEFTVDVVNDGSIDAMIDSVVKTPELTTEQAKYIKYEITYANGESINEKQTLKKETTTPIKVRIEYRKDLSATDLPSTTTELSLGLTLVYIQSDGSGGLIPNNGVNPVTVVSGDGTQVGNELCIKEECFYVISSTESTVTMLSKYNLYVSGEFDENAWNWTAYGEEATGRQDSTMIGYGPTPRKGTTKFSDTNYWKDTVSSYPAYVYDENSILYGYVENYKTYLSTLGVTPSEARLITYEELTGLGCTKSGSGGCKNAPEWVYGTSYWLGSAIGTNSVWNVDSNAYFGNGIYNSNRSYGVRPVITISRSLI